MIHEFGDPPDVVTVFEEDSPRFQARLKLLQRCRVPLVEVGLGHFKILREHQMLGICITGAVRVMERNNIPTAFAVEWVARNFMYGELTDAAKSIMILADLSCKYGKDYIASSYLLAAVSLELPEPVEASHPADRG